MKMLRTLLPAIVVAAAGLVIAMPAGAHGTYRGGYWGGPRVSFVVGAPLWWGAPYYVGAPWVYGPPPAAPAPPAPMVYVERSDPVESTAPPLRPAAPPAASAPGTQWWYLCASPRGAYPYVRECPGGWERVPAAPPAGAR